jgi:ABC-2 type transport system permease protein
MNRALWIKSIREARLLWLACAALLYGFCWVRVWITSQVDMSQFRGILRNIPEAWQRLSPVPVEQLVSYPTRIAMTYEEPLVYLAIALWAVARSSDCVSGEIGRGTMEMLLSQPTSRAKAILIPTAVTVMGTALLVLVAWGGTWTGIATASVEIDRGLRLTIPLVEIEIPLSQPGRERVAMRELVAPGIYGPAILNVFALGFFLIGLGSFLSACDRYRWRTIGILVAIYVLQMIVEVIALTVQAWGWLKWLTFFSAYEPIAITSRCVSDPQYAWTWVQLDQAGRWVAPGPLGYDAVLIGLGLVGLAGAILVFQRRDVPAPL